MEIVTACAKLGGVRVPRFCKMRDISKVYMQPDYGICNDMYARIHSLYIVR